MRASKEGFEELLTHLSKRWRLVRFVHRFLLREFYSLLASAILFAIFRLLDFQTLALISVPLPTLLFLLYLTIENVRSRKSAIDLLWDADVAHGTRHLLPAAYGAQNREESEPVSRALAQRAIRELPRVRIDLTYPWRIPFQTYLIPVALLAILMVALFVTRLETTTQQNPWLGYVEQLREESEAIARAAEEMGDEEGAALAEELSALADMLEERPEQKETQERVATLLPKLESRMRRLGATDLLTDPSDPRTGGDAEAEQRGTLRAGRQEGEAIPLLGEENGGTRRGEGEAPFDEAAKALEQHRNRLAEGGRDPGSPGASDSGESGGSNEPGDAEDGSGSPVPGGGSGQQSAERLQDEESSREGTGSRPGNEAVADLADEESPRLDGGIQRLFELPESENEANSFTELFAREAPGTPESTLAPEEQLAAYRRQLEEAVKRTEIPPELEGVVRDYFLKIGEEHYE